MSDLQNQTPADTYKGLLQVGDYTNGVDGNSEYIQDGEGTNSALSISTTKVGVGTVSPSAELDVSGNVVADEYALDQVGASSSAVAIHAPATNELAIRTNTAERVRIDSSGNVGINSTSPDVLLTVKGALIGTSVNSETSLAQIEDGRHKLLFKEVRHDVTAGLNWDGVTYKLQKKVDSVEMQSINFVHDVGGQAADNHIDLYVGGHTSSAPSFSTRFAGNGHVGIGTDSPSAPLEISSTTGGVIMPRMTTTQRDAISSPTDGEMIYNTTTNKFQGRANGAWVDFH